MNRKIKALGLVFFVAMAMGAVAVVEAGATVSGHFTSDSASGKTTVTASEGGTHTAEFSAPGLGTEPIHCTSGTAHGEVTGNTTQLVTLTATVSGCTTTGSATTVTVTTNGCVGTATPASVGHATGALSCPAGKKVVIHDPGTGCTLSYGTQTVKTGGAIYKADTHEGKHSITAEGTASGITFTVHGGICSFIATTRTNGEIKGTGTMHGIDPASGSPVNITAT
jgi:hypothetical protein